MWLTDREEYESAVIDLSDQMWYSLNEGNEGGNENIRPRSIQGVKEVLAVMKIFFDLT